MPQAANLEAQLATERIKKEAKPLDPAIKRIVERIGATLHTQADAACARIAARRGQLSAGDNAFVTPPVTPTENPSDD